MKCKLVDVFARQKLSGNGLTIFYDFDSLSDEMMLSLTREMRQFESIFVSKKTRDSAFRARIFTMQEELDFAGHPVIGLAAHLHDEYGERNAAEWEIELNLKTVKIRTEKTDNYYRASMDQGVAEHLKYLSAAEADEILAALNLKPENISTQPLEVVSTGLPYLIVPIKSGIENAKIMAPAFEVLLAKHGARFVYILDVIALEGRTWDHEGGIEDIATGSAAGPAAAFLCEHGLAHVNKTITLSQGRFLGRPSQIEVLVESTGNEVLRIWVSGEVSKVARICFV